jgi:putative membrane protein
MLYPFPAVFSAFVVPMLLAAGARPPQDPRPDDAAILSLLVRVGTVEIECTTYAFAHATLPEAKELARQLRDDHTQFLAEGKSLATRLGITLNPTIKSVVADSHAAVLADLHNMTGDNLDRAFVDHEALILAFALNYLDRTMVPAAKNTEIKALIVRAEPLLRHHLELARQAQAKIRHT